MVPQSGILHCLKCIKYLIKSYSSLRRPCKSWRVELTAGEQRLAEVKIQRGIFQGDAQSPLLFVIAMMPFNYIPRKCTAEYKFSKSQEKINHLMYMVDIKLFAKKRKRIGNPNTNCENIQSRYRNGIWHRKCAMLVMKCGKRRMTDGVELPTQIIIRTLREKETYKYLGIVEADTIKQVEMKENIFTKSIPEIPKISRGKTLLQEPCQKG